MIQNLILQNLYDFLTDLQGSLESIFKQFNKTFNSESYNLFAPSYLLSNMLLNNVSIYLKGADLAIATGGNFFDLREF